MAKEANSTALPPEVSAFINGAQPRFKDEPKPDQFCGREGEHKSMMRIVSRTLRDSAGVGTHAGPQLIAAPGVGKTSITAELECRLTPAKIVVNAAHFEAVTARGRAPLVGPDAT